jgi:hypothetical protein
MFDQVAVTGEPAVTLLGVAVSVAGGGPPLGGASRTKRATDGTPALFNTNSM